MNAINNDLSHGLWNATQELSPTVTADAYGVLTVPGKVLRRLGHGPQGLRRR